MGILNFIFGGVSISTSNPKRLEEWKAKHIKNINRQSTVEEFDEKIKRDLDKYTSEQRLLKEEAEALKNKK